MNQELLNMLGAFIKALRAKNEVLIKDFVVAKVTDQAVAKQLEREINSISSILNDLADADTTEKLKKCLEEAQSKLTR